MRKLISLLLALVMVMGLATVAMAADLPLNVGTSFAKKYTVNNGTAPAEDFEFEVTYQSFKNNEGTTATATSYPTVTLDKAEFENALTATATANASVSISNYAGVELGVYTYQITEKIPTTLTAGTTYCATPVYLVVTILRDEQSNNNFVAAIHYSDALTGDKTGSTENKYDAGQLSVTKHISGNMADMDKKFAFTATFTPESGDVFDASVQVMTDGETTSREYNRSTNEKGQIVITFELGDGETATFTNVPANATYTVVEVPEKYTSSWTENKAEGKIEANEKEAIEVTNTLIDENIDTGITLDSVPFVVMMIVCAAAAVLFVIKRRNSVEF